MSDLAESMWGGGKYRRDYRGVAKGRAGITNAVGSREYAA